MGRSRQQTKCSWRQRRPYHHGLITFLGVSFLLLFAGCAQLDQLMGKQAASDEQPPAQNANAAPAKNQVAPAAGVVKHPQPDPKQADHDKALAERDQPQKEKKSHVASDKKSTKKPPKPQAESQPPTEDVFFSPVPLPSKPAAIGGSGG